MSHDIDDGQAQVVQEALIAEGLHRARTSGIPGPAVATGFCHNCQDPIPDDHRFCDGFCLEDWEKRKRAETFRRK